MCDGMCAKRTKRCAAACMLCTCAQSYIIEQMFGVLARALECYEIMYLCCAVHMLLRHRERDNADDDDDNDEFSG